MKSMKLSCIIRIVLAAVVVTGTALAAFGQSQDQTPRYTVIKLGTLGGIASGGNSMNDLGWEAGFSYLTGNQTQHAALWAYGLTIDLGTLGGPNSSVAWPNHNDQGAIAAFGETAEVDPLGEDWSCSAFFPQPPTHHQCLGFIWQWGAKTPLPTLGGENGYAAGMNNRGQVVGWAETPKHDSTCVLPQVRQFEGVIWGPGKNQVQILPPYNDDPDSAATSINNEGQVVGVSGICQNSVGDLSAKHAVLWQDGKVIDIGNLGGSAWNTPGAINDRGEVVGFSDLPGDQNGANFNAEAFLWKKNGGIQNLGTLPGDTISEATGINNEGQIVGLSCVDATFANCRAFLWQNGVMTDLNALVSNSSSLLLYYANDINSFGQIAGQAIDTNTGVAYAFLGIPNYGWNGTKTPEMPASSAQPLALPQSVREQLQRGAGIRRGAY